jgi:hypothetical protein
MAMLMTLELPGGTTAQYDRTNEILGIRGEDDVPPGLVVHSCCVTDEGILIVDVWDSVSALDSFAQDHLRAALAEAGTHGGTLRTTPVHEVLFGLGTTPNVLVVLEVPGLTAEAYDAIVAKLPSHADGSKNHPSVMHVAAEEPDGFRITDLWDSEAAYMAFATSELLPAVGDPRHFVLRTWPVHSCLGLAAARAAT